MIRIFYMSAFLIAISGQYKFVGAKKIETLEFQQNSSLEEAKNNLVKLLNENALAEKSGRKFKTTFEGNFLRIIVLSRKNEEELNGGILYDLSNVYKFYEPSLRDNDRAYVDLWTDRVRWPKREGKERMDKIKLTIRVNNHQKAQELVDAFKLVNAELIKQ